VELRIFAQRQPEIRPEHRSRIHCGRWLEIPALITALADCDLMYCPYLFDPSWGEDAELCYPSKITTYLASGRPLLFHGPAYASPARFLREWEAGFICHSQEAGDVAEQLTGIFADPNEYFRVAQNGERAFRACLTHDALARSLREFLVADVLAAHSDAPAAAAQ
jgi:hypothetical protein